MLIETRDRCNNNPADFEDYKVTLTERSSKRSHKEPDYQRKLFSKKASIKKFQLEVNV